MGDASGLGRARVEPTSLVTCDADTYPHDDADPRLPRVVDVWFSIARARVGGRASALALVWGGASPSGLC